MAGNNGSIFESCHSCDRQLRRDQKFCECGAPSPFLSFEERTKFEVEQWRRHKARNAQAS